MNYIFILATVIIMFLVPLVIALVVDWFIHLFMSKSPKERECVWMTYKEFKKEFIKHTWIPAGKHSCMDLQGNYFYISMIVMNNKSIRIANPIGYHLAKHYVEKYIKNTAIKQKEKNYV